MRGRECRQMCWRQMDMVLEGGRSLDLKEHWYPLLS